MKTRTIKLLAVVSIIYLALLFFFRSLIPETLSPTAPLLALPLMLLAVVILLDLSDRATRPTTLRPPKNPKRVRARDVQFLTRQIEVGTKASPAYFDNILRDRLRHLLIEKVSLETGIEIDSVRRTLQDPTKGPLLLKDPVIYRLLYYSPPRGADARLQMLQEITDRIEGWKA